MPRTAFRITNELDKTKVIKCRGKRVGERCFQEVLSYRYVIKYT